MINVYKLDEISIQDILKVEKTEEKNVDGIVKEIIDNVRTNGDKALFEYAEKFDKVSLDSLQVTSQEIDNAFDNMDKEFIKTLEMAKENITLFHTHQLHDGFEIKRDNGVVMGQKYTPIEKAGLYVPGGTASYPSTVLMDAIPAKIAGVSEIVMVTPPDKNGNIQPEILAAAKIAGVTKIFKIGGASAIAALAYGTQSIPQVDKIVGPGNIFVATAKRMVFGKVDIDMIAGPSDILVLADETANPRHLAADMLGQAEHDTLATSVLITTSEKLAMQVKKELEIQTPLLHRSEIATQSLKNNGKIIIASNMQDAIYAANTVAPEHLEVCVQNPFDLLNEIKNAGSIFLGNNTPEALGDYLAGPNHTLPTEGTARFSSPLSVDDFVKKSSYLYYTKEALQDVSENVYDFAMREGLQAHANSVKIRFEQQK